MWLRFLCLNDGTIARLVSIGDCRTGSLLKRRVTAQPLLKEKGTGGAHTRDGGVVFAISCTTTVVFVLICILHQGCCRAHYTGPGVS